MLLLFVTSAPSAFAKHRFEVKPFKGKWQGSCEYTDRDLDYQVRQRDTEIQISGSKVFRLFWTMSDFRRADVTVALDETDRVFLGTITTKTEENPSRITVTLKQHAHVGDIEVQSEEIRVYELQDDTLQFTSSAKNLAEPEKPAETSKCSFHRI